MKVFNKIIIVGPNSGHVQNFILLIKKFFNEIVFIGEEPTDFKYITKSYVLSFRSKNPLVLLKNRAKLLDIFKKEKANFIHIHSANRVAFVVTSLAKKINSKIITTTWGSDVLLVPKKHFISKKMVQFILNHSDYITADSQEMITTIKTLTINTNIKQVLFGITPLTPKEKEKIIYSNRLHKPLYNIDKIIDEFYFFSKKHPEWKLIVGAIGSETENLKQKVTVLQLNSKVEFVGWLTQEDNNKYYQKSYIYISIPSSDGTAVSLLEAMSAGCIPIVNDLKVSNEWIQNGLNGLIIKKEDENIFEKALQLDQNKASNFNQQIIKDKATKTIASNHFYQIYNSL